MHDWKAIAREKLNPLPLSNKCSDEVIEEIAQQLESAYEEALARGITDEAAVRNALNQIGDWERLRSRVFQSVEGARLPIWVQRGVFAPRRLPVWIALALALAFLAVPAFRQALTLLPMPPAGFRSWDDRVVCNTALRKLERSPDQQTSARALAFVAIHSSDHHRAMRAAEEAIALDPRLTWVAAAVSHATDLMPDVDPRPWINRLKAWDPNNAYPYLLEASAGTAPERQAWLMRKYGSSDFQTVLARNPAWRAAMEKAFASPRVDFYRAQGFALDREMLQREGFDRPQMLLFGGAAQPWPSFTEINAYYGMLLDQADAAAKAGHADEALAKYSLVVTFGEKLSSALGLPPRRPYDVDRRKALSGMLAILAEEKRTAEAQAVRAILETEYASASARVDSSEYKEREVIGTRSGEIVLVGGLSVVVFGAATLLWLFLIAMLKWKPKASRALNSVACALCFAPSALVAAALMLFLGYFPYARPISQIASRRELIDTYGPLLNGLALVMPGTRLEIWFEQMFWPIMWCAVIVITGVVLLRWQHQQRVGRDSH